MEQYIKDQAAERDAVNQHLCQAEIKFKQRQALYELRRKMEPESVRSDFSFMPEKNIHWDETMDEGHICDQEVYKTPQKEDLNTGKGIPLKSR